jgi:hypothetical protein
MTLRGLIEAIERSDDFGIIPKAQAALGEIDANYGVGETVCRAFHGSLDAAAALHDALLPGCSWGVGDARSGVYINGHYRSEPADGNPARAWLLAILCALEGGEE